MRWKRGGRRSGNLQDQRAAGPGLPFGLAGGGIGGIVLLILFMVLGGKGGGIPGIEGFPTAPGAAGSTPLPGAPDPEAELVDFVSFVLDDVQATWQDLFRQSGKTYEPAKLVLFRDATQTGCGSATSAVGPFYCPPDRTAYLDLGFFRELHDRFGAPGDFAQAYVLAHEIAHHVQNLLGISEKVQSESASDPDQANALSIKQELQADCLAGVWGYSTYERKLLDGTDLKEGLAAAAAVGDDRIQKQSGQKVNRESWTHGSAEERQRWFKIGFDSGDPNACDTFAGG